MEEWYYVRDGKQQGPVSLETLREMAAAGELKPEDKVWTRTMTDWTPAQEVDGILPTSPTHQTAGLPEDEATGAERPATSEITPGSEPLGIGACVSRSFKLTTGNFLKLVLVGLAYLGVMIVVSLIMLSIDEATGMGGMQTVERYGRTTKEFVPSLLNRIVTNLVSTFLSLGAARIGLNLVDGKPFRVGMLFGEGSRFLSAVIAVLLFGLLLLAPFLPVLILAQSAALPWTIVSPLLFIAALVMVYLSLRFGFYLFAIVDKDLGAIEALQYSSKITTGQRLNLFLLWLVMILIIIAGMVALLVGLILAIPVALVTWVVAYRWLQYGSRVAK